MTPLHRAIVKNIYLPKFIMKCIHRPVSMLEDSLDSNGSGRAVSLAEQMMEPKSFKWRPRRPSVGKPFQQDGAMSYLWSQERHG